jgi:hypothetical protein
VARLVHYGSRGDRPDGVGCRGTGHVPAGEVGKKSSLRQAFWYHRMFSVDGPVPVVAILKIHKARYGTKVYLNAGGWTRAHPRTIGQESRKGLRRRTDGTPF